MTDPATPTTIRASLAAPAATRLVRLVASPLFRPRVRSLASAMNERLAAHIVENAMLNGEVVRLDGALRMPPR